LHRKNKSRETGPGGREGDGGDDGLRVAALHHPYECRDGEEAEAETPYGRWDGEEEEAEAASALHHPYGRQDGEEAAKAETAYGRRDGEEEEEEAEAASTPWQLPRRGLRPGLGR